MIQAIWFLSIETLLTVSTEILNGMIPEKVTWVRFPARINTVYGKLPPINDLFLKILIDICHIFLCRILDQNIFSTMQLHQNLVRQNKFFNFSPNFLYYFLLIWPFQEQFHIRLYLQKCKLVIVNSHIKTFPIMLLRQLNFGVLLA